MPAMVEAFKVDEKEYRRHLYNVWLAYQERKKDKPPVSLVKDSCPDAELKVQLFGYMLDEEIRRVTNGRKSFYDVIAYIYKTYALGGRRFSTASFVEAVNTVAGVGFTDFIRRYLYGVEKYPVVDELERV